MDKRTRRLKRAKRCRCHLKRLGVPRLTVHRSLRHIQAQVILPDGGKVISCASTLEPTVRQAVASPGNCEAAAVVGRLVAERCLQNHITQVGFDRSGSRYHGRVKALAEAARSAGLKI